MYATLQDMTQRFGEVEVIRLSSGDGPIRDSVDPTTVDMALSDATAMIDGYLRKRYQLPLAEVPPEVVRATCVLARHDLASGGGREPSTQMRNDRNDVIAWLNKIAEGYVTLASRAPAAAGQSARFSDRERAFQGGAEGW